MSVVRSRFSANQYNPVRFSGMPKWAVNTARVLALSSTLVLAGSSRPVTLGERLEAGLKPFIVQITERAKNVFQNVTVLCENDASRAALSRKIESPADSAGAAEAALKACRQEGKLADAPITILDPENPFKQWGAAVDLGNAQTGPIKLMGTQSYDGILAVTADGRVLDGKLTATVDEKGQIKALTVGQYPAGMWPIGKDGERVIVYQFDDSKTVGFENAAGLRVKFTQAQLRALHPSFFKPAGATS